MASRSDSGRSKKARTARISAAVSGPVTPWPVSWKKPTSRAAACSRSRSRVRSRPLPEAADRSMTGRCRVCWVMVCPAGWGSAAAPGVARGAPRRRPGQGGGAGPDAEGGVGGRATAGRAPGVRGAADRRRRRWAGGVRGGRAGRSARAGQGPATGRARDTDEVHVATAYERDHGGKPTVPCRPPGAIRVTPGRRGILGTGRCPHPRTTRSRRAPPGCHAPPPRTGRAGDAGGPGGLTVRRSVHGAAPAPVAPDRCPHPAAPAPAGRLARAAGRVGAPAGGPARSRRAAHRRVGPAAHRWPGTSGRRPRTPRISPARAARPAPGRPGR